MFVTVVVLVQEMLTCGLMIIINHNYFIYMTSLVQWNSDLKLSFFTDFAKTQTLILLPDFSKYPIF